MAKKSTKKKAKVRLRRVHKVAPGKHTFELEVEGDDPPFEVHPSEPLVIDDTEKENVFLHWVKSLF